MSLSTFSTFNLHNDAIAHDGICLITWENRGMRIVNAKPVVTKKRDPLDFGWDSGHCRIVDEWRVFRDI